MSVTVFHLGTCSTCQKIIKMFPTEGVELHDIKTQPISEEQLDSLKEKVGSYEALFSRRAMKFRSMQLHEKELAEADYRSLILQEYTFLKRPVILVGNEAFVGSAKKTVEMALNALN